MAKFFRDHFLILVSSICSVAADAIWREVSLVETDFTQAAVQNDVLGPFPSAVTAAGTALLYDWCLVMCRQKNGQLKLSSLQVAPYYKGPPGGMVCFTRLEMDKTALASVSTQTEDPVFKASNMVKGINRRDHNGCAQAANYPDPWFLVDLGEVTEVSKIILTAHTYNLEQYLPINMEILGSTEASQFPNNMKFLAYAQQDVKLGEDLVINLTSKENVRYLKMTKITGTAVVGYLKICFLQIF